MFEELKEKIKDKKLIILGEVHGTKEIPLMISGFFSEIAEEEEFNVCLEIPEEFQKEIDEFIKSGNENVLENISFFSYPENQDGRGSLEYINLIKSMHSLNKKYKRNIRIFCVDPNVDIQEEKERGIADKILNVFDDKRTFVILGDVHASKDIISVYGKKFLPAGAILFNKLRDKMFNIRVLPKKGKFFNLGIKEISKEYSIDSFNENFDYIFEIDKATPCSFQRR